MAWAWPSTAAVAAPFDEGRNKGLVFTGKAGDPVLAAADGRVVYAGSGLRGFGNLVIVDHGDAYMSLYGNNESLYKRVGDSIRGGEPVAAEEDAVLREHGGEKQVLHVVGKRIADGGAEGLVLGAEVVRRRRQIEGHAMRSVSVQSAFTPASLTTFL